MTYHITGGHMTSAVLSGPVRSYTPIKDFTGLHWGVWVFSFGAVHVAVPPPWGDFKNHEQMSAGLTHVAIAGAWPTGFLGDAVGAEAPKGRIYFDPSPNGVPTDAGQLEGGIVAELDRLVGLPSDQQDPDMPPVGDPRRQLALLAYIFNHLASGPFAPFHQLTMQKPRVAKIEVKRTFPDHNLIDAEYEQIEVQIGDIGGFKLRPYRGAGGEVIRLTNAEPQLRDDIYLGEALDLQWKDLEIFPDRVAPDLTNPLGEARDFDWQWPAMDKDQKGPPITGVPHA